MKSGIRSFLEIEKSGTRELRVTEAMDYETNAAKNRIWYRGDSNELEQLHQQLASNGLYSQSFWAAKSTPGLEIRKAHTGLPSLIVNTLVDITLADANSIEFDDKAKTYAELWKKIDQDNNFMEELESDLKETLHIGDGAYKYSFDPSITEYPIIEFYPGDRVDYVIKRGRLQEIVFKTYYTHASKTYELQETYGYGYIRNKLYRDGREIDLASIPETSGMADYSFGGYTESSEGNKGTRGTYMLAVPIRVFKSQKWPGRGQSIFDRKVDNFDAFDEVWSQWMAAFRAGKIKQYIPESLIPRDPKSGKLMKANPFDNQFIAIGDDLKENGTNKIQTEQPTIDYEGMLTSYSTALDLCLQGLISPSTLGIDMKKLDNAEAQREKEKATLYSRNAIVGALQKDIPDVIKTAIRAYNEYHKKKTVEEFTVDFPFGEYANPSFESQIETISKGRTGGILSIEASVEELYGDTKDKEWKLAEVLRLKTEQGVMATTEPGVGNEPAAGSESAIRTLNGAQIQALLKIVESQKSGELSRSAAISMAVSTLGVPEDKAISFIEEVS